MLHLLLSNGYDPKVRCEKRCVDYGLAPIHIAAMFRKNEELQVMLEHDSSLINCWSLNKLTPLHVAAKEGSLDTVELLVSRAANVNAFKGGGWTALQLAASAGHIEIVAFLLSVGADKTLKGYSIHPSALELAIKKGHSHVCAILNDDSSLTETNTPRS